MAKNDPERPEVARAAQDVGGMPERENKVQQGMHHGRGGGGNVIKKGEKEQIVPGSETAVSDAPADPQVEGVKKKERSASKSMLDAAKEGLNKLRRPSGSSERKISGNGKEVPVAKE